MAASRVAQDAAEIAADLRIVDEQTLLYKDRHRARSSAANRFIKVHDGYPEIAGQAGQIIYDHYYIRPGHGRGSYRQIEDRLLRRTFVGWLADANATRESWSDGWEYVDRAGDQLVLRKPGGRVRAVTAADFEADPGGKTGRVRTPPGSELQQPGWYHVRGAEDHSVRPRETVRLYFAVSRSGAAPLVHMVSKQLNEARIPFHLKVDSNPDGYRRADAGVLYLPIERWADLQAPLRAVRDAVWPYLRDRTPLFTKPLAPGIGLADEPLDGGSFGTSCGALCGVGLWDSRHLPAGDTAGRVAAIEEAFQRFGKDVNAPYLAEAGKDPYDIRWESSVADTALEVLR